MHATVLVRGLLLFLQIHAPISFGEQLLRIFAIRRKDCLSDTQGKYVFGTDLYAGLFRERAYLICTLGCGFSRKPRSDDHKLVASHSRHIVVFAAAFLECLSEQSQHAISFEVAEAVVDLFKTIHVTDHYR